MLTMHSWQSSRPQALMVPATGTKRLIWCGALAGAISTSVFTAVHQLIISSIWFAFPIMVLAGVLCGASIAWSYGLIVRLPTVRTWILYNLFYLTMFGALGITSVVVFEPVATIAALLQANEPPRELIARALPMTVGFAVAAAIILSLLCRPDWRAALAILVTTGILILFLGLNISVLGLVGVPNVALNAIAEVLFLLTVIMGVYAAAVVVLGRSLFENHGAVRG